MNYLKHEIQKIYLQMDKILLIFASLFFAIEVVWVPINSFLAETLLQWTGHAYVSPTNVLEVLAARWWVTFLFFVLILLNLVIAYVEIGFVFVSVRSLLDERVKHMREFLTDIKVGMARVLVGIRFSKVFFVLCYGVVLFPFLKKLLNIYYFNKIIFPQFLVDYFSKNIAIALGLAVLALLLFYLSTRLMYALPQIYFEQETVVRAVRYSWGKREGKNPFSNAFRLVGVILQAWLFFAGVAILLYVFQGIADTWPDRLSFVVAICNYVLLQLSYYGATAIFLTKFVSLLTDKHLPFYRRERLRQRLRIAIVTLASLYFGAQGYVYLYFPFETLPVTISHRGVTRENGVQNTIDSLEKTARLRPDYIEMDVQETKDGQFVVMHDTDLKALTGHSGGTHDYTLAELTEMTASENGFSSPIPSFEEYLTRAEALQQKLLVEIKVTSQDSPQMMKHFLEQYGNRLLKGQHQLQSLDYNVVIEAEQFSPNLVTSFILPFNSIYPTTMADAYTMEYSSLDQNFVVKSWFRNKLVYAWTPNDEEGMLQMIQLQVDGIITDNLEELQSVLQELNNDRNYQDLLSWQTQSLLYAF